MPNINNIVNQLKNRKVFRSLAIYAGFAFVLLQVCDIVIPRLFLPDWTMTFIIVLTIIGFPIIAVLSWIYDIIPSDGKEPSTETTQPIGIYALTGLVLTVIGVAFWVSVGLFGVSLGGDDEVPSIAIIPFDNKGAEEDEFYAYSISSELISDVASAGRIRVASKKQIEDVRDLSIDDLAKKLLVRYVVTGDLWKADSVFQLSMELYDTELSKVLWSESWQKEWDELTSIKGNLADNILKTLRVSNKLAITKSTAYNSEAYEIYLRGKFIYQEKKKEEDIEISKGLFEQAIAIDSNLVFSYLLLGDLYFDKQNFDKAEKNYQNAKNVSNKIDDDKLLAYSLKSLSKIYLHYRDYDNFLLANKQVAEIFNTLNDKKGIAENFEIIGDMYEKRYDEEKARVNYEKSRNIYEELGYKRNIANNILKLAKVIDCSDWRESEIKQRELYETALELYRNLGDKSGIAKTLTLLGSGWYFEIFSFGNDKNIEYLLEAIEIYHELNDINNLAINYSRVASSYQSSNELSKTIHSLNNAIKYFEISDLDEKSYKIKNCNNKLIETYIKLSNKEQALELIQERNNYHKDNKDSLAIVQDYLTISKLYYHLEEFEESNKYLYEALDISESLDDKSTIIEIKEKLVANMSAINKYNLAESILNESFVIRESLSNDSMNVQFKQCRMLAPLYYESGKYVQSLENFKECAQHDSIQYQENRDQLNWMHGDSIEYTETINISKINNSISQYLCMINIDHMEQDVKKLEININQLIDSFDNLDTLLNKISIRSRRFWWFEGQGYSLSSTHIIYYHLVLKLNEYYYLAGNEKSRRTIINIGYNHLNNNYLKLEDKEKKYYLNNYYHQRIMNEWEKSNL